MYLDSIIIPTVQTNCYLVGDEKNRVCAVIDPGGAAENVLEMIRRSRMEPKMILLTHGHYDHVLGIPDILQEYPDLLIYIHEKDLCPAGAWEMRYFLPHQGPNQRTYNEGDRLPLGDLSVRVLHTPGHSAGSVALVVGDVLFSGDTLFSGSCGRSDLPGGSETALLQSLARLGGLEGDYKLCPGHGDPSTLACERKTNVFLLHAMAHAMTP